ncbi:MULTISPECIES: Na/Pi cotransporter family protein [unclassified Paenibacillus]|uniref:Na/Pi cotransporter family protein n=1 Tax=unclassified Paenibacillus TaxID=185978 RepID=UPI000839BAF5|nr:MULTISPECIES: Na/Pi symporter [unclassified Paenibacillus]NWL86881.1 Na/Pi cotransporter family protein [Paenibacillus sp. 79R4]
MVHDLILPVTLGLALFLFGMKLMEAALHAWAGPRLIKLLHTSTKTPWAGLLSSTFITAVLQSSTAMTVMTIGLVNAGLLSYARTLGIILGGNIGTCLTTELIALDISSYGLPLLTLSLLLWAAAVMGEEYSPGGYASRRLHFLRPLQYGSLALAGFSLIMIAIRWMQSIGPQLEAYGIIDRLLDHAGDSLIWGALAGAAVTALIHSSAAAIAMTMGLVSSGALPVPLGIAMVIGSNVGTCVTALIASIGGTKSGKFVALSHVILNLAGALLFLPFVSLLQTAVSWVTNDAAVQIAHSQTLFNVISSLLALPFCYLPLWSRLDSKA